MPLWAENLVVLGGLAALVAAAVLAARGERWRRALTRFRRDRLGLACLAVVVAYGFVASLDSIQLPSRGAAAPVTFLDFAFRGVAREKSYSAPLARTTWSLPRPEPLRGRHLFGTDVLGKDVLLQTLKACRTALIIGGLTSLIYIPLGVLLGIAAGYFKGRVDDVVQFTYSTLASVPNILLLVAILMALGKGLASMAIALGATGWVGLCRLIRGEALRLAERPFVEAARALGQRRRVIVARHILPNVMHLVIINFVLGFSGLVLAESVLSYIGVGAPVSTASWGLMIDGARMELSRDPIVWWNLTAATGALFVLVLALNLLGDSLQKAFDPRTA
ncbi:MAG: ABC transporter permease [Verrucomicrobiae bacterium]|nr:ABC transporter permease [Verrucomicrobiae bacterium]